MGMTRARRERATTVVQKDAMVLRPSPFPSVQTSHHDHPSLTIVDSSKQWRGWPISETYCAGKYTDKPHLSLHFRSLFPPIPLCPKSSLHSTRHAHTAYTARKVDGVNEFRKKLLPLQDNHNIRQANNEQGKDLGMRQAANHSSNSNPSLTIVCQGAKRDP
jgi:hypothetical protein